MVLRLRAALPDGGQELASRPCASCGCARPPPRSPRCARPARPSTGCTPGCRAGCGRAAPSGRSAADISDAIVEPRATPGPTSRSSASGPNAASPHQTPAGRVLQPGDAVVVDIGGTMPSGYCSDCTRTYAIGAPPPEFAEYYGVLQAAQEAACAAVRPGSPPRPSTRRPGTPITAAGYGELVHAPHRPRHRAGDPRGSLHRGRQRRAAGAGQAFSVEPGIYPGPHGARIEDIVVCTEHGGERLNNVTHDLVVVDA